MSHTKGPWRPGPQQYGAIVSDNPHPGVSYGPEPAYGGYVIAESVLPCNMPLIIAAPDLLAAAKFALHAIAAHGMNEAMDRIAADRLCEAIANAQNDLPPAVPEP